MRSLAPGLPISILVVLQHQVKYPNPSRVSDYWLAIWLDPTVNVRSALSETLGEGVGMVCLST